MPSSHKFIIIAIILTVNSWVNASQNKAQESNLSLHLRIKDHIHNKEMNNHPWFESNKKKLEKLGWDCPNNATYVKVEWLCKNNKNEERHWLISRLIITKHIIAKNIWPTNQNNKLGLLNIFKMIIHHPLPQYVLYEYLKDCRRNPQKEPNTGIFNAYGCNLNVQYFDDYKPQYWTPANESIPITAFIYDFIGLFMRCIAITLGGTLCLTFFLTALFYYVSTNK